MTIEQLNKEASRWTKDYLSRDKLGSDEELQMLSAAYAQLFLSACANKSMSDLADAHRTIADCLKKLNETQLELRHRRLAESYQKQS